MPPVRCRTRAPAARPARSRPVRRASRCGSTPGSRRTPSGGTAPTAIAALSATFTNTIFGFMRAGVLIALWHARPSLGGYDVGRRGDVQLPHPGADRAGADLRRQPGPHRADPQRRRRRSTCTVPPTCRAGGSPTTSAASGFALLSRGALPLLGGSLVFSLRWPSPAGWAAFAVRGAARACWSASGCATSCRWRSSGCTTTAASTGSRWSRSMFFSGMIVPLVVFPGRLGTVAHVLPWAALIQLPGRRLPRQAHRPAPRVRLPGGAGRWRCSRPGGCSR